MAKTFKELMRVPYKKLPIKIVGFEKKDTCFLPHWHDRIELLYIIDGSMTVTMGDKVNTFEKDELAIINPGQLHTAFSENGVKYYVLMFEPTLFSHEDSIFFEFIGPLFSRFIRLTGKVKDENINKLIEEMINVYNENKNISSMILKGDAYLLMGRLFEKYIDASKNFLPMDHQFKEVLDYIDNHFTDNLTTTGVAKLFSYDKSYFCRKFKLHTKLSFVEYITILRLELSLSLLLSTNDTIQNIAFQAGFSDANYFSRMFKKRYGFSPAKWRMSKVNKI